MPRNYVNESNWQRKKYIEIRAKIDRQAGERFKAVLEKNGIKYADWLRERIAEYLGEE